MMGPNSPEPGHRNAPSTRGGVVLVSLYSWTLITLAGAIARYILGSLHKTSFGMDDGMVIGGSIVFTGSAVAWQYAVNGGLGKHFNEVSPSDAAIYFKSIYAAQLLQIAAMAFAKLSSAFLVGRVAPQSSRSNKWMFSMIGFYTVYALLVFSFQCGLPQLWRYDLPECGHGGPHISVIALNIISDLALAIWIFPTLRTLHMDNERRITVAVLFGSRAIVPLMSIGQIWAVAQAMDGDDPTWDTYALALFSQAVTSLSLIAASLPRIKRFVGVAGSGIARPIIDETELADANSHRQDSNSASRIGSEPLKLVPSGSGAFTTTVVSKNSKKEKNKAQQEWDKLVSMGSKTDDHTSTSSLFEHQGVMMHQEVTVHVDDDHDLGER